MDYLFDVLFTLGCIGSSIFLIWRFLQEEELTPWRMKVCGISMVMSITTTVLVLTYVATGDLFTGDQFVRVAFFGGATMNSWVIFYGLIAHFDDFVQWFRANLLLFGAFAISASLTFWLALQLLPWFAQLHGTKWLPEWLKGMLPVVLVFGAWAGFFKAVIGLRRVIGEKIVRWHSVARQAPYFFLLRSFSNRFNFEAPEGLTFGERGDIVPIKGASIIPPLITAISYSASVVVLGEFHFGHGVDVADAIQIKTPDKEWEDEFELFARHAKGIVIIPSNTPYLLEEFRRLRKKKSLWRKTIIFIPPKLRNEYLLGSVSNLDKVHSEWPKVIDKLRSCNVDIPLFDGTGLFHLPKTGHTVRIREADVFQLASAIRSAFLEVVSDISGDHKSFDIVYRVHRKRQLAKNKKHHDTDTPAETEP